MIKQIFKYGKNMALKDIIKEARLKQRLKQDEAAKMLKVTVQTYSKWENGKTEPKASQVAKLSEILCISTQSICYGKESKKIEFMDFMRLVSSQEHVHDVQLYLAIWETIDDDYQFIEHLKHYTQK